MEPDNKTIQLNDDEISLPEILHQGWTGRWIILITTIIFIAIAIIYLQFNSYSRAIEYESQATLLVETPSPDSLISVLKNPVFMSELLKTNMKVLATGGQLSVAQILDQQTKPPQGNLAALTNRINGKKDTPGILMITVMMQDPSTATQLTDSVVKKLTQFLEETQLKRAFKNQKMLAEDTARNFQILRETAARNLEYMSKATTNTIQFMTEGSAKDIRYMLAGNSKNIQSIHEGALKEIEFQKEGSVKSIQSENAISAKNIQFLTEGYLKAESIYLKSQQVLAEYYKRNSTGAQPIDTIEVKKLNSDIKLKYNVFSDLYQQLEQSKIEVKKQEEQVKIEADYRIEQAKINADKIIGQAKIDANEQLEQAKLNMDKQLEQVKIDADKQLEQSKIDAEKQLKQAKIDVSNQIEKITIDAVKKIPEINVLERPTIATQITVLKTKKVLLMAVFFGIIIGIGLVFGKIFYEKNFGSKAFK